MNSMYENNFTTDNNNSTNEENITENIQHSETEEIEAEADTNSEKEIEQTPIAVADAVTNQNNRTYQQPYYQQNPYSGQYGGQQYQYNQYQYTQYPQQPPMPPKKRKGNGGLVAGLLIAALVIGGASGFGGSYLARRLDNNTVQSTEPNTANKPKDENTETEAPDQPIDGMITAPEYVKPDADIKDDLSGLNNMVSTNTTTEYTYAQLFEKVNESIVVVTNYVENNGEYQQYGTGSGVIFTTDGYIVTNYHVVEGSSKLSVTVEDKYSDNEELEAVLVGSDSATDLAVLKIARTQPFTAAALGNSDNLKVGQEVCAIGAPLGLAKSISNGIVSGLNRYNDGKGYVLSSIQTNAAINPGNSGGGLFDMYGNVVGIVNSKLVKVDNGATTTENLGFAITINEAKPILSDLINYGLVKGRPMLGIVSKELSSYEAQIYGFNTTGLLVTKIDESAPAAHSELQIGDIITHINGERVEVVEDVQEAIKNKKAGDKVTVTVVRTSTENNGYFSHTTSKTLEFELTLTETK